ncbi:MAG: multidrug efflux SMR transporter [Bowdeniella nasicola]|nr:multidrug efflux SMR transporter [Bowdeniella nasicola]
MTAWIVLILSGLCETIWAVNLARTEGFTKLVPLIWVVVGAVVSMGGLAWALKSIPVGTGYAVWVGVGAVTTALYAWASGAESMTLIKALLLLGIVACVAGLHMVESTQS